MTSFHSKFSNYMRAYNKRTKKDLLLDPLVVVFQTCNDPATAFSVLQEQLQVRSWISDRDLITSLHITIDRVYAISSGIGPGVISPEKVIMVAIGVLFSVRIFLHSISHASILPNFFRRLKRVAPPVSMRSTFSLK